MAGRKKSFRKRFKKAKRKLDKEEAKEEQQFAELTKEPKWNKDDFQHEAEQEAKDADNGTIPKKKVNENILVNTTHQNTVLKSSGQDVVLKSSRPVVYEQEEEQADGDETVQEPVQADSAPTISSLPLNHDIPREISKHVSEWKRFGRFLRFSDGRLNQIEIEHSKCYDRVYTIMTEFCYPEPISNSWSFWKKKLSQYPEGDKIIKEIEITVPQVINEAPTFGIHGHLWLKQIILYSKPIFRQDNMKLFEDLVYRHSIDISKYRTLHYEESLLHLAAKYNASRLCTLICNQCLKLVCCRDRYEHIPLEVAILYNSDLVASILEKHGANKL